MLFCITLFEILTVLLWTVYLYKYVYRGGVIVKTTVSLALLVLSLILGGQLSSLYSTGHYIETNSRFFSPYNCNCSVTDNHSCRYRKEKPYQSNTLASCVLLSVFLLRQPSGGNIEFR